MNGAAFIHQRAITSPTFNYRQIISPSLHHSFSRHFSHFGPFFFLDSDRNTKRFPILASFRGILPPALVIHNYVPPTLRSSEILLSLPQGLQCPSKRPPRTKMYKDAFDVWKKKVYNYIPHTKIIFPFSLLLLD